MRLVGFVVLSGCALLVLLPGCSALLDTDSLTNKGPIGAAGNPSGAGTAGSQGGSAAAQGGSAQGGSALGGSET